MSTESWYAGGAPSLLLAGGASSMGQDGVTIVDTGDSLLEVDLLLIVIVLPVAG